MSDRSFIIGGHPRSGTTLLMKLCHAHPDMTVTFEFTNFAGLGDDCDAYRSRLEARWATVKDLRPAGRLKAMWRSVGNRWAPYGSVSRMRGIWREPGFKRGYVHELRQHSDRLIDAELIDGILRSLLPATKLMGDKYPGYVFELDRLTADPGLKRIIIYRDCRDVVNSVLRMVRTDWRKQEFVRNLDTAAKIARRWVEAIEATDRHRAAVHLIRYESLVTDPAGELKRLAEYLDVDPDGFPVLGVRTDSVGNHHEGLTTDDLETVLAVGGPALNRLGYL